ncbi:MAG: ABC transporter substrate-binding protein [Lachnospiraceae bacterium]|jgi:ABC-type transport system substrate-binding protein
MRLKKLTSLVLASAMVIGSSSAVFASDFTPADSYDPGERSYTGQPVTTGKADSSSSDTVTTDVYAGEEGKDYTDEGYYTYNNYMAAITGLNWDPLSWETSEDSSVMDYIDVGFYRFVPNSSLDGYSVQCEMAAALPEDVTDQYVGQYGVEEGDTAKAFRIALNPNATWENGEAINADSYIYSMQQQLNPKMMNRRADSFYQANFAIVNAKNYLYAGQLQYTLISGTAGEEVDAGNTVYIDMWGFWGLEGMTDADGNECPQYVSIDDDTMYRDLAVEDSSADEAWVSAKYLYENYFAPGAPYESYGSTYCYTAAMGEDVAWEDVGLVKVDDYTIDLIFENTIEQASFYVPYNLATTWLVYEPLYEECKTFYDADGNEVETEDEAATVTTNYCTSLDTTIAYGPYKMTYYELDKQITYERNDSWYGYSDGNHLGQYQADRVVVQAIEEHATALMSFLSGELDTVSLESDDMETYASSDYILYTPQSYTTKITFNLDYDKLLEHGTNSQILVIDEFRHAFALALNREEFATAYTSAGTAGFGILNYMYVYDPFTGATYRDSEAAKIALLDTYGISWGEGTDYATVDDAYNAMTGYDMEQAQALMAEAYDKAVAAGIYDGTSDITIDFRVYQSDDIYVQMFNYLNTQLQEACKGSGFEGKVSLTMTVDADYYNTMYSGGTDMIFTTWGGADMAPYQMLAMCYCDASDGSGNQMELGFDTSAVNLTMNVDGTDITDTLQNWAFWANAQEVDSLDSALGAFNDYDMDTRAAFYANMEECYLAYFATTPLYYRNVASLHSQKVNYPLDTYLTNVGFGEATCQFTTFNYTDDAWADYIANNTLQY